MRQGAVLEITRSFVVVGRLVTEPVTRITSWESCDRFVTITEYRVPLPIYFHKVVREDVFLYGLHHKTLNDWSLVKPVDLSFPSNLNESLNTEKLGKQN